LTVIIKAQSFCKAFYETAIIQNEYYLSAKGNIYVPDTSLAMKRQPNLVAFNGKAGQYIIHPIHVKAGERIRLYFLNVGPNNISSFRIIGSILDKVWLEGNPQPMNLPACRLYWLGRHKELLWNLFFLKKEHILLWTTRLLMRRWVQQLHLLRIKH
jgi:hypothetical protein